jgi:hypothetical protein
MSGFPGLIMNEVGFALMGSFMIAFVILFFSLLLRRKLLGLIAAWLIASLFGPLQQQTFYEIVIGIIATGVIVAVAGRLGILGVTALLIFANIANRPITTDLSAWYASEFVLYAIVLIALALFGFYTSTAGQKLWQGKLLGDEV